MKRFCKLVAVGLCLGGFAGTAFGFDGNREGFVLGIGVGGHHVFETSTFKDYNGDEHNIKEDFSGFGTSFRLGYGFNDNIVLYYANEANFFKTESSDDLFAVGATGVGLNYYNSPDPGSFYSGAIIGVGIMSDLSNSDVPSYAGIGIDCLIGYEFTKFTSLQLDYLMSWLDSEDTTDLKDAKVFKISLQFNFY